MDSFIQIQNKLHEIAKKSDDKKRACMYSGCSKTAIKSHVLQKNGILREISEKEHLMQLCPPNPFEIPKKGLLNFKRVGINDCYTFKGFCKDCDDKLFKLIETERTLDFEDNKQKALFCYRGLCQEIRRKEIGIELMAGMNSISNPFTIDHIMGTNWAIKNLSYFKQEFENSLIKNDFASFEFSLNEIPKIDLCISVPLNIGVSSQIIPYGTTVVNVFPKGHSSIVIVGYNKYLSNAWTNRFINIMNTGTKQTIFKELSDLLTLRLEFWAMSQSLFKKISKKKLKDYSDLFFANISNHNLEIQTKLNLFASI